MSHTARFAHPHPLHNVFGLSEVIGCQAHLAFALTWRRHSQARSIVTRSLTLYPGILIAIALNQCDPTTLPFVTLDARLAAAAEREGFAVLGV